jgi:hypothetical protein
MKRLICLAPLMVVAVLPFISVQACGPDFYPDVFVRGIRPDHPKDYAAGMLGVLLPTYPRADLAIARRYLNGAALTADEQKAYQPTFSVHEAASQLDAEDAKQAEAAAKGIAYLEPLGPADTWLKIRSRYAPPQAEIQPVREYGGIYSAGFILAGSYENCQSAAFETAIATLQSRAKTWGAKSTELADWIKGQDAVFSNCGGGQTYGPDSRNRPLMTRSTPSIVSANAPLLLQQDRAYQRAATQFYSAQFETARLSFQAIANDTASPWCGIARYLVARSLIREAFLSAPEDPGNGMANFNPALLKQAQKELESMRGERLPGVAPSAVQNMLNLVRIRTEPEARLREISLALTGPKPDPYYQHDLDDLTWYLNGKLIDLPTSENSDDSLFRIDQSQQDYAPLTPQQKQPGFEKAYKQVAGLRSISPLIDWLITWQSPAASARNHAISEWKRTNSTPWLAAALLKASGSDPDAPALIAATRDIPSTSPAWATMTYHRLRLLIESGQPAEARIEIVKDLSEIQETGSKSALNLFTSLRMHAASTLEEALLAAPRTIQERTSEEYLSLTDCLATRSAKRPYDCEKDTSPLQFSEDSAAVFNNQMPLVALTQAAQNSSLPPSLRQSVAIMTWVRSVLLKNDSVATQMFPLLPQKLQTEAGSGTGFHPLMAILRNPGLRPYLDAGVQRSASWDFVESYSDNWWCSEWLGIFGHESASAQSEPVAFLAADMRQAGKQEAQTLRAQGSAEEFLGSQVIEYSRAHPSDPDVPEALYLTLRMIRYGCYHGWARDSYKEHTERIGSIAREVGALMRQRYPYSPWTKKAAPFVWPAQPGAMPQN